MASRSASRVQNLLASLGNDFEVVELPSSTRTAVEAAAAVNCSVEQIAKSILFRTVEGKRPVMVIASGVNRVNEHRVADILGELIEKADAAYVREKTGFVIGGVPPFGHAEPILNLESDETTFAEGPIQTLAAASAAVVGFGVSIEVLRPLLSNRRVLQ